MLPLAAEALLPEDWDAIDAAFASNDDPVVGVPASKAFRELFRHLVAIMPPPLRRRPRAGGAAPRLAAFARAAQAGRGHPPFVSPFRHSSRRTRHRAASATITGSRPVPVNAAAAAHDARPRPRMDTNTMIDQGYLRHPDVPRQCDRLRLRRRPVERRRGRRHRAPPDRGPGRARHAVPVARRQWLAFVGRDEQHPEVYLMPAEGGPARRMTWLGPDVMVRGWTRDGHILFVTTHGQPFFRNYRAFTLDPAGGLPQLLPLGQVNHLAFGPGNAKVIGRNTADPARWKRYRGGTAGHLWIDAEGSGTFRRMTELARQHHEPDVDRRSRLLPDRRRGRGQSLFVQARRRRPAAAHRARRLLRAPRADRRHAHRLSVRRADSGASIRATDVDAAARHPRARASHAGGAQVRAPPPTTWAASPCIRPATAWRSTCAASSYTFGLWEGAVRQHGMRRRRAPSPSRSGSPTARRSSRDQRRDAARSACRCGRTARRARCRGTSAAWSRCAPRRAARSVAIANHRNEVLLRRSRHRRR